MMAVMVAAQWAKGWQCELCTFRFANSLFVGKDARNERQFVQNLQKNG
jgi:hypothetical protein